MMRCPWMLEELGVPYENVPTHFATGDCNTAELPRIDPNGRIPAMACVQATM